jgi:hypothetical protein
MRFMMIVKASPDSEAGVLLAAEGVHARSKGARVRFTPDGRRTVIEGPFAPPAELIAGFWLIRAKSRQEVIDWALRCPCPQECGEGEIEIRQVFEAEDFGQELTPELRALEERLRAELADKARPAAADRTGAATSPARGRGANQGLRAGRSPEDRPRPHAAAPCYLRAQLY